jgi:hypothetical protein
MKRMHRLVALAAVGTALAGIVTPEALAQLQSCAPPHRMRILDLDMHPDPVHQGQPVQRFTITVQWDRRRECLTSLEVRDDGGHVAGRLMQHRIRPGTHRYAIPAVRGYRFRRQDNCFRVVANIENAWASIDAARQECARFRQIQIDGWTLNR